MGEAAIIAEKPKAAKKVWTYMDKTIPSAPKKATFRPCVIPVEIMNKLSGPGMTNKTNTVKINTERIVHVSKGSIAVKNIKNYSDKRMGVLKIIL